MKAIKALLWCALFLLPNIASAQLSQQSVQKLIAEMDRAIGQRDVAAVARLLSDGVEISTTVRAGGQSQKVTMNKKTYVDELTKAWAAVSAYEHTRSNVKITLSGPSRALVSATVKEKLTVQGQQIFATSNESAVIELVGGRPLVTRVSATTQLE